MVREAKMACLKIEEKKSINYNVMSSVWKYVFVGFNSTKQSFDYLTKKMK